jgi:hypothetical protein
MTLNPFARIASLGWAAWLATLVATACLCAVLAYWFMQIAAPRAPIGPALSGPANRDRPDLTAAGSLFGTPPLAQAAAAPVLGNVQVLGVVAAGRLGSAILIVDGKPARSFAVGDSIGPGQRVRSVRPDKVVIDDNGRMAEVPAPALTSTAVLTSGVGKPRGPSDPALMSPASAANPGVLPVPGLPPASPAPIPAPLAPSLPPGAPPPVPIPGSSLGHGAVPGQGIPPANNLVKPATPTS